MEKYKGRIMKVERTYKLKSSVNGILKQIQRFKEYFANK
jgi:hypothetical protein